MFYVPGGPVLKECKIRYDYEINHSKKWWHTEYLKLSTLNKRDIGPIWNELYKIISENIKQELHKWKAMLLNKDLKNLII